MPASFRPWIAASECSGVLLMCDQSSSVVTPALSASSAPAWFADAHVLRAVVAADVSEHRGEVLVERAAREDAAHRRLPRVPVRVHESGHDDHPGRIDLLRVRYAEVGPDVHDDAVLDEDFAVRDLADVGVHRDDEPVPEN